MKYSMTMLTEEEGRKIEKLLEGDPCKPLNDGTMPYEVFESILIEAAQRTMVNKIPKWKWLRRLCGTIASASFTMATQYAVWQCFKEKEAAKDDTKAELKAAYEEILKQEGIINEITCDVQK